MDETEAKRLVKIQHEIRTWITTVKKHCPSIEPSSIAAKLDRLLQRYGKHSLEVFRQEFLPPSVREMNVMEGSRVTQEPSAQSLRRIAAIFTPPIHPFSPKLEPLPREVSAMRLKAVSMLKKQGDPFPPKEIASKLQRSPIEIAGTALNPDEPKDCQRVTLTQRIELFPGEIHKVFGTFKRLSQTSDISIPIPESFHIVTDSQQNAFPAPSQHTGWAASESWIPWEEAPFSERLAPLYQKKGEMAKRLLPNGERLPFAKKLLRAKREAFLKNREAMLDGHRRLCLVILDTVGEKGKFVVDRFFDRLRHHPAPFVELSDIHAHLNRVYVAEPLAALRSRERASFVIGEEPPDAFTELFGKVLGDGARTWWQGEKAHPLVGGLQACALRQLTLFLEDLERDQVSETLGIDMLAHLEEDIHQIQSYQCSLPPALTGS